MNVLFLSLGKYWTLEESGIYTDLLRQFVEKGHKVYALSPVERREKKEAQVIREDNATIVKVKIGNIQKTNVIEKGISTLLIELQFMKAVKKYFSDIRFDLVLYPTPPITFVNVVEYIKKRDQAFTYLLLKDIFPQNAVDLGMLKKTGLRGLLYHYFRKKEKKLYEVSDRIGCMSPANVEYVLKHNPLISATKVEVCPNCIEPADISLSDEERMVLRRRYGIPQDKKVFVYGGNLGAPQGIPVLIECLRRQAQNDHVFFLIVGEGTEYGQMELFMKQEKPANVKLMPHLPKADYDKLVAACDVGMIFLDHRFTIPNFPSRILTYMQAGIPVLACTDSSTDMGRIITEGHFGWWCESNDPGKFSKMIEHILQEPYIETYRKNSYTYLLQHYSVELGYSIICRAKQTEARKDMRMEEINQDGNQDMCAI